MSIDYDLNLVLSNKSLASKFKSLMRPEIVQHAYTGRVLDDYDSSTRQFVTTSLNTGVLDTEWFYEAKEIPSLSLSWEDILAGIEQEGPINYLLNLDYEEYDKLAIEGYDIKLGFLYKHKEILKYDLTVGLVFYPDEQGYYGEVNKDLLFVLYFPEFAPHIPKLGYKPTNFLYMRIMEILQPKYAFTNTDGSPLGLTRTKESKTPPKKYVPEPWSVYDHTMIFGADLVKEMGLDRIKWENEKVYYFKWLRGPILWLSSPWGIAEEWREKGEYTEEIRAAEIDHRTTLEEILNLKEGFEADTKELTL